MTPLAATGAPKASPLELSLAECGFASPLLVFTLFIVIGHAVDAVGLSINAVGGAIVVVALAIMAGWCWRRRAWRVVDVDPAGLAGFLIVTGASLGYCLWWSRRGGLLPGSLSPDVVHHASLTEYVYAHARLPHGQAVVHYLGELASYPAGSHLLAAVSTRWLGLPSGRLLWPLVGVSLALQAGIVYCLVLRLLPAGWRFAFLAAVGTGLLLLPMNRIDDGPAATYFLGSVFGYEFFFAMVVNATFVVGMLWAVVRWNAQRQPLFLALFAAWGMASFLTWPVWLPVPVGALAITIWLCRDLSPRRRCEWMAVAIAPIVVVAVLYELEFQTAFGGARVHEGTVGLPYVNGANVLFLVLAVSGVVVAARHAAARPLLSFLAVLAAQIVVMRFAADRQLVAHYIVDKMLYLLLYPATVCAALGVVSLVRLPARGRQRGLRAAWQAARTAMPVVLLAPGLAQLPPRLVPPPFSMPLYHAGRWARATVPVGCVDYYTYRWITEYWLHVSVLGNPRDSDRTRALLVDAASLPADRWRAEPLLPYAILDNLEVLPGDVLGNLTVLYQSGGAAVVQRVPAATCVAGTSP